MPSSLREPERLAARRRQLDTPPEPSFDELPLTAARICASDRSGQPDREELDTDETARLLGVGENTAKVRLYRARQALRELLASELPPGRGRVSQRRGVTRTPRVSNSATSVALAFRRCEWRAQSS